MEHEIDAVRALLIGKPRPVGWAKRRARIDELGAVWLVADDINLEAVHLGGCLRGDFSLAPGRDSSRVLIFFRGGGYCSGSIVSHRRMVTEAGRAARTLAVEYRLAPEHPFPAAHQDALSAWRCLRAVAIAAVAVGGDRAGGNSTICLINAMRAAGEPQPAAPSSRHPGSISPCRAARSSPRTPSIR